MFPQQLARREVKNEQARKKGAIRPSTTEAIRLHFASVPLFAGCSKHELRLLAKTAVVETRASGATLMTEGARAVLI